MDIVNMRFDEKLILVVNGEKISITIQADEEDNTIVSFGVSAPKNISVNREEIYQQKQLAV